MQTFIEASNLVKTFGALVAVDHLDLAVSSGEIFGLVGPDGAGKTTTIRLLCAALKLDAGKVTICGFDLAHHVEQARAQLGYLPQRFSLYEDLTVLENLRFFAEVRGLPTSEWLERCMHILSFVGLGDFVDRRAGYLSGGMKQKLGLAAALVHRPRVLLLDEPTTGVDPVTRQDFWQLIIRLVEQEGVALLVSTPYMDEAIRCHRIGFMQHGKFIVQGTPTELLSLLKDRIIELRGSPLPLLRKTSQAMEAVEDAHMFGDLIHLRVSQGQRTQVLKRLKQHLQQEDYQNVQLKAIPAQLEDVFIAMLESQDA